MWLNRRFCNKYLGSTRREKMNFKEFESKQKLNGVYYTPLEIAKYVTRWASGFEPHKVLEPSCGGGAFIDCLLEEDLEFSKVQIQAFDIDDEACASLQSKYNSSLDVSVVCDEFLQHSLGLTSAGERYDCVLGNPPFIRYQYLDDVHQNTAKIIFEQAGLKFTKHTNAWVPFVIQSLRLLKPGGVIGMVLPAEIMHVMHAGQLRKFAIETCRTIEVVNLQSLFSDDVLQGVVLFLAQKKDKKTDRCQIRFNDASDEMISNRTYPTNNYTNTEHLENKWMVGLLSKKCRDLYLDILNSNDGVKKFGDIATANIGIVTGANKYFVVPNSLRKEYQLDSYVKPMYGRSSLVKGVIYSERDHQANAANGKDVNFLHFDKLSKLTDRAKEYVELGEAQSLHTRYKCRIREPWYEVPYVEPSDISMLKRSHFFPRVIFNSLEIYTTDTAYRIKMKDGFKGYAKNLVYSFVNSLTALSAELEGRHYGGGVIELVPSEIKKLSVPLVTDFHNLEELDQMFRGGVDPFEILLAQDRIVLREIGLSNKECEVIHSEYLALMNRRIRKH